MFIGLPVGAPAVWECTRRKQGESGEWLSLGRTLNHNLNRPLIPDNSECARPRAQQHNKPSSLSRNHAVEEASERGVYAASACDLPARRNANGKLYSVTTLKRRERRAPILVLERPRRFASLSNCIVTA